ncbi:MAG: PepSY domain-containing protein [Nesterenkonia sp.]
MTIQTAPKHRKPMTLLSVAAVAALGLSACSPDDTEDGGQAEDVQTQETSEETSEETDQTTAEATETVTEESTASEDAATTDDTAGDDTATADVTSTADAGSGGDHPVYQAVEAALAEYDGGVITQFEDNTDDDGYVEVYVYDGETEQELEVDSESFEIINTEEDDIDGDDREEAEAVEIEISEAIQTAESEGGAEPTDGELDTEDGTVVWQIELDNDTEVYVDVTNGDVVTVDQ